MSCRIAGGVLGRPPRGLDFQRQYARKPARCQPITVSGLRIFRASSTPGAKRYSPANTTRSMLLKTTRFGHLRLSTLSWCRRTRTSASNAARDRNTPIRAHQINSQISFIKAKVSTDSRLPVSRLGFAVGTRSGPRGQSSSGASLYYKSYTKADTATHEDMIAGETTLGYGFFGGTSRGRASCSPAPRRISSGQRNDGISARQDRRVSRRQRPRLPGRQQEPWRYFAPRARCTRSPTAASTRARRSATATSPTTAR